MQKQTVSEGKLVAGMVVSMMLWGLSWPSGKVLTHYTSAFNMVGYRYIIVFSTLLLLLLAMRMPLKISFKGIVAVIISGILLAVYSYFIYLGLKNGAAGQGGVLVTILNPIVAYSIKIVIERKWPGINEGIGLILGLIAGCILLQVWSKWDVILDSGNMYFLMATAIWAAMSKITSKGATYGSSLGFSLWQYLVTLICLLPLMDMQEAAAVFSIRDKIFWINMIFNSAIVTTIATTVYFYTTTRMGAEKASSFIFLVPLAATLASWFFLKEPILLHTAMGGLVGLLAVYMINKRPIKTKAEVQ